jgi:hypothetical protein
MSHLLRGRSKLLVIVMSAAVALMVTGIFAFNVARGVHAAAEVLYVGTSVGSNTSCASPGYTSVQAAVDAAASGNTVHLCGANTYLGPVVINKKITLVGDSGATIGAPSSWTPISLSRLPSKFTTDNLFDPQALLVVWGSHTKVTISHVSVSGTLPGNGGCADDEYGIVVIDGATATISHDAVENIYDANSSLYGCQFGVGIQIGRMYWPTASFGTFLKEDFVGHATISDTSVSAYQKNGIDVDGPSSTGTVNENTVTGAGRDAHFSPIIAQNGIEIARGAAATVTRNLVQDNSYTGSSFASSGGILIYGGCSPDPITVRTVIKYNTVINNDVGIYLANYQGDCSPTFPPPAKHQTKIDVEHNYVSNDAVTNVGSGVSLGFPYNGYQAGISDVGNDDSIVDNTIAGAGYHTHSTQGGPFVLPIDTTSSPTIDPHVHGNKILS